jgi:hypothetical protein
MKNAPPEKHPPKKAIKSLQFDLFTQFITNEPSEVSNTVEIWESIPKYFFTAKQVEKLRTKTGHADPYKWEYLRDGVLYAVKIQPALIEQGDGNYKAFFPSVTEELVEEALKKIFSDQQYGIHDAYNDESWVRFTLKMIQKELKARGRSRDINQIKQAIEVMSSTILTFYNNGKEVWKGSILQDLVTIGREEYLADTDAHHVARLPLFISLSINRLEYRQFNYDRFMGCNEQLSRWIYKRLINRFKQASLMNQYHFLYSDLKASGLLQQTRERDNRSKVISSLNELVERGVLLNYEVENRKEGKIVIDVKYTVFPSVEFVSEQKAANMRSSQNKTLASQANLISVD